MILLDTGDRSGSCEYCSWTGKHDAYKLPTLVEPEKGRTAMTTIIWTEFKGGYLTEVGVRGNPEGITHGDCRSRVLSKRKSFCFDTIGGSDHPR